MSFSPSSEFPSRSSTPFSQASRGLNFAATRKDLSPDSPRTGMAPVLPPGNSLAGSPVISPSWSPAPGSLILGETPPESPRLSGDLLDEKITKYSKIVSACTVNTRYYFDDEISFFKVENQKFKVHRHFLARDSIYFQELFAGPLGNYGAQESEAIPLDGIGSEEFECLLDFFYNGMYGHLNTTLSQWITLLSISTRLRFDLLRAHAIKSIEESSTALEPVDKVVLAIKYNIPEWLAPAYTALCRRPNYLEEWEAEKIGLKRTVQVARAREAFRNSNRSRPASPSVRIYSSWNHPAPASPIMDYDAARAANIVDEVFFS